MTFAASNLGLIDVKRRIVVKKQTISEHCSCKANMKILKRNSNNICVTFEGKVKHSSLEIKRLKTTGENREHYKVLLEDNASSSN